MAWINRTKVAKFGSMVSINDAIGISHLERFKEYNLGNYVNLKIHWHKNTTVTRPVIEEAIKFCVENKIYFSCFFAYFFQLRMYLVPVNNSQDRNHATISAQYCSA